MFSCVRPPACVFRVRGFRCNVILFCTRKLSGEFNFSPFMPSITPTLHKTRIFFVLSDTIYYTRSTFYDCTTERLLLLWAIIALVAARRCQSSAMIRGSGISFYCDIYIWLSVVRFPLRRTWARWCKSIGCFLNFMWLVNPLRNAKGN